MQDFNETCYFVECEEHSEEWHKLRLEGIGGSDAAVVLGMNPYKNNVTLWEEKMGLTKQPDLSENEAVIFGSKAEEHLRSIYALKHKKEVQKLNGTLINKQFPFIRVNVDGYIAEDNGLWEGKTGTVRDFHALKKWSDSLPPQYYAQCIHALAATGLDYIELSALIYIGFSTSSQVATLFEFRIERKDVLDDIEVLIRSEVEFWEYVKNKKEPFLMVRTRELK